MYFPTAPPVIIFSGMGSNICVCGCYIPQKGVLNGAENFQIYSQTIRTGSDGLMATVTVQTFHNRKNRFLKEGPRCRTSTASSLDRLQSSPLAPEETSTAAPTRGRPPPLQQTCWAKGTRMPWNSAVLGPDYLILRLG